MTPFEQWKKGFMRKCRNSGKIWFCNLSTAKKCLSFDSGFSACSSNGSCDRHWREQTKYFGRMLEEKEVEKLEKEKVEFT